MTHLRDARSEFSTRLALDQKRVEATERRTAVMERLAEERARAGEARREKREMPGRPRDEFAARRAEMEAILTTARSEIAEQLLVLCALWQGAGALTVAQCCADLSKLAHTIREHP